MNVKYEIALAALYEIAGFSMTVISTPFGNETEWLPVHSPRGYSTRHKASKARSLVLMVADLRKLRRMAKGKQNERIERSPVLCRASEEQTLSALFGFALLQQLRIVIAGVPDPLIHCPTAHPIGPKRSMKIDRQTRRIDRLKPE